MTEQEANIYNWILDSFGEPVFTGDWIFYRRFNDPELWIGQIVEFTNAKNPRVTFYTHESAFRHKSNNFKFLKGNTVVQSSYVKCFNKNLINELIKLTECTKKQKNI